MWKCLGRSTFTLTLNATVVDAEQAVPGEHRGLLSIVAAPCGDLEDRVAAVELQVGPSGRGSRRPPIVKVVVRGDRVRCRCRSGSHAVRRGCSRGLSGVAGCR